MIIEQRARIMTDTGVPMEVAVEEAAKAFQDSYSLIAGVYVNTRDRYLPTDFESTANRVIADFERDYPGIADGERLTLWPDDEQGFWYISDEYGIPMEGAPHYHVSQLHPEEMVPMTVEEINALMDQQREISRRSNQGRNRRAGEVAPEGGADFSQFGFGDGSNTGRNRSRRGWKAALTTRDEIS